MRHAFLVATLVALLTAILAAPAWAHPSEVDGASNYASHVERIVPSEPAGLEVRVVADGMLSLRNGIGEDAVVGGYEGEPYLRVGPGGVFVNAASPTAYLVQSGGAIALPDDVGASLDPRWERVSEESAWSWHDDRVHWAAATAPPQVKVDSSRTVRVLDWQVPVTVAGGEFTVVGSVIWVPAPAWPPWVLAGALVVVAPLVIRRNAVLHGAALGLALAATFALIRGIDLLALPRASAVPASPSLWPVLGALLALAAAVFAWRRPGSGLAVAVGGLLLVMATAADAIDVLGASQVATRLPDPLARLCAAVSVAAAIPAVVGLVVASATTGQHDGDDRAARDEAGNRDEQPTAAAFAGRRLRSLR